MIPSRPGYLPVGALGARALRQRATTTQFLRVSMCLPSAGGGSSRGSPSARGALSSGTGTFATGAELDAWLHQREEAERRDHRRLGRELDLFSIQEEYGEGLILWHPKGGIVRKELEDYLRQQLLERGYGLVYTPHIARRELWWTSGHEENFADAMFSPMASHETEFRLKPMNCPFHIGIYRSAPRSYRDLPMRLAELGTVYRAELAGTLQNLAQMRHCQLARQI